VLSKPQYWGLRITLPV